MCICTCVCVGVYIRTFIIHAYTPYIQLLYVTQLNCDLVSQGSRRYGGVGWDGGCGD